MNTTRTPGPASSEAIMQAVHFDIHGMTCGGCSMRVQHVLGKLDGVGQVEVKLRPGFVTVMIDPERVTPDQIVAAIAKVGFTATAAVTVEGAP